MKRNYIVIPSTDAALQFLEKITRFIFLFVKKREDRFGCIKPAVDVANQYIFIYPFWSSFSTLLLNCYYHETFQFFSERRQFPSKIRRYGDKELFFYQMNETAFVLCSTSVPNFFLSTVFWLLRLIQFLYLHSQSPAKQLRLFERCF